MLTKELLEVTKRKPTIAPRYRDIDEYQPVADQVIEAYEPGTTRGEIEAELAELETHDTFKLIRGLSKLFDRWSEFEQQAPAPPDQLREAVFEHGFVTSENERQRVVATVADEYGLTPEAVETGLWAGRDSKEVVVSTPDSGPKELLRQYNLSATQTLLFDAVELEFSVSDNYQEIFGLLTYLGLMYTVNEDLTVNVTGPAALFKQTRKYGTTVAKLVPSLMKADEWSLSAHVETEVSGETRIYEFSVNSSRDHLFPEQTTVESFDSAVERDFAARIDSLADGWTVTREPTILRTGNRVMIPDFSFERAGNKFYLEVIGFWTPEYLAEKVEKVRQVRSEQPLILAINADLNCTRSDFDAANVEHVFFYDDQIPVKPVLDQLHEIDEQEVRNDFRALNQQGLEVSPHEITDMQTLATAHGYEPDAVQQYIEANYSGVISNGTYVPESVLAEMEAEIDALDSATLAAVNEVLEPYGVAQGILEDLGYTVHYVSLDQDEATITKEE